MSGPASRFDSPTEATKAFVEWFDLPDLSERAVRLFRAVAVHRMDVAEDLLANRTKLLEQKRQAFSELYVAHDLVQARVPFILKPAIRDGLLVPERAGTQEVTSEFAAQVDGRWVSIEVKSPAGDEERDAVQNELQSRLEAHEEAHPGSISSVYVMLDDPVKSVWKDVSGLGKAFRRTLKQLTEFIGPVKPGLPHGRKAPLTYKGTEVGIAYAHEGPLFVGLGGPNAGVSAAFKPSSLHYYHKLARNAPNVLVVTFLDNLSVTLARIQAAFTGAWGQPAEFAKRPLLSALVLVDWDQQKHVFLNPYAGPSAQLTAEEAAFFARKFEP